MKNNMQVIENIEGVRCYIDDNDIVQLNLEDVARGLGFTQNKNQNEYIRWETVGRYLKDFGFSQQAGKDDYIPEPYFYLLAMKAENDAARAFQQKVAFDILPTIRRTGAYMIAPVSQRKPLAGEAASLIKQLDRIAIAKDCTPQERSEVAYAVCQQLGVKIPECFIKLPEYEQFTLMVRK